MAAAPLAHGFNGVLSQWAGPGDKEQGSCPALVPPLPLGLGKFGWNSSPCPNPTSLPQGSAPSIPTFLRKSPGSQGSTLLTFLGMD